MYTVEINRNGELLSLEVPKITQENMVLAYLKKGYTLTTRETQIYLHAADLGKIVSNLRRRGHNIIGTSKQGRNIYGKNTYTVYKLEENNEQSQS